MPTFWGAYAASPELVCRFHRQKAVLESGSVGYQCLDFLGEAALRGNGVNCVHALTPLHGLAWGDVLQLYGDASGWYITGALQRRGLVAPLSCDPAWLFSALGLDGLPFRRR